MAKKVTVRLSDESCRGWDRTCLRYGVTLTALLEATGLQLLESERLSDQGRAAVERAREIDKERRSRG